MKNSQLAILALAVIGSAFVLGRGFKNFRPQGTITVKGLAEVPYKASLAQWSLSVGAWGANYKEALNHVAQESLVLEKFLRERGFEFSRNPVSVNTNYEEYIDDKGETRSRPKGYNGNYSYMVISKDLDKVQKAWDEIQQLRAENSHVDFERPSYLIDGLEKVKLELITKATLDAKTRAEEFVKSSDAEVGAMKRASQGSFSIYAPNSTGDSDDYGGSYDTSTIDKVVRLVVTVEYAVNN